MQTDAQKHLARVDPVMRRLIRRVGPCTLGVENRTPFEALVCAVAHQQLNGTAAATILARFRKCVPRRRFPRPLDVALLSDDVIRAAGFSRSKVAAIRGLAERAQSGELPTRRVLAGWDDESVITCLTQCRGVGRWTAEMFLMFTLGRPDVLPVDDFGVRSGYQAAYGGTQRPTTGELSRLGERWRPYRSTASWYLWRAADLAK